MDLCESEQLREVFFAYACKRQKAAKDSNQRFVYYTSTDAALKIVERGVAGVAKARHFGCADAVS